MVREAKASTPAERNYVTLHEIQEESLIPPRDDGKPFFTPGATDRLGIALTPH